MVLFYYEQFSIENLERTSFDATLSMQQAIRLHVTIDRLGFFFLSVFMAMD